MIERESHNFILHVFVLLVLAFVLCLSPGCSIPFFGGEGPVAVREGLKSRALVLPVSVPPDLPERTGTELRASLMGHIEQSSPLVFRELPEDLAGHKNNRPWAFQAPRDPELLEMARNLEVDLLISAFLAPVKTSTGKSGIWPFRDQVRIYDISLLLNAVDVRTGIILFSNVETKRVERLLYTFSPRNEQELKEEAMEEALSLLVERQASSLAQALRQTPWTGKILSTHDRNIVVEGGKELGLKPGQVFEVFSQDKPIPCYGGKSVPTLGEEIGKIKLILVGKGRSQAIPVDGGPFAKGQVIRLKP